MEVDLFSLLNKQLDQLSKRQLSRRRRVVDSACGPEVLLNGRTMLAFCSNDYLGLANDERLFTALNKGVKQHGLGAGASALISGHYRAHQQLEDALAALLSDHIPNSAALCFNTGYMANLALITSISAAFQGQLEVFSERLNHASLIDGIRLARANYQVYPHADLVALEKMLASSQAAIKLLVSDSVFSMDGRIANLPQLLELAQHYNAWLLVDDAHGFGVLGSHGRGVLEHFNLCSPRLIYMGTLGKAAGLAGAFVCADKRLINWMLNTARSYIYTTAMPPAMAQALQTSLTIISGPDGNQRRQHLQALIALFRQRFQAAFGGAESPKLLPSETAIQPIVIGDNQKTLQVSQALEQQGFWVPAIRPPTVAPKTARLRITLSAAHSVDQLNRFLDALIPLLKNVEQKDNYVV